MPSVAGLISLLLLCGGFTANALLGFSQRFAAWAERIAWSAAVVLFAAGCTSLSLTPDVTFVLSDVLEVLACAVALSVWLFYQLLSGSGARDPGLLIGAGLVVVASTCRSPLTQWLTLQMLVFPVALRIVERDSDGDRPLIERLRPAMASSILMTTGFGLLFFAARLFPSVEQSGHTIGVTLIVCGLGGLLNWFPYPLTKLRDDAEPATRVLSDALLPSLCGLVFLFRFVTEHALAERELAVLAVLGLDLLGVAAVRLTTETDLARRARLCVAISAGFLLLATCLAGWEAAHPHLSWVATSNLPSPLEIWTTILLSDVTALVLLLFGFRLLTGHERRPQVTDNVAGSIGVMPGAALLTIWATASLAGIPPFPGFWGRFQLLAVLLLPHRRSSLTGVTEPHRAFVVLAVCAAVGLVLIGFGQLKFLQRIVFDEPFRVRRVNSLLRHRLGAALATLTLTAITLAPFVIARWLLNR